MKILLCKIIRWLKSKIRKNTETNLVKFARVELDKLLNGCGDKNSESYLMQKQINDDIIEIVKSFSKQGHSGFSASYALNIIKKLLNWKPILPLTGEDDEWKDCGYFDREGNRVFQNRRCSAVFKDVNNDTGESRVKYIDKYVISDNGGITWFSSRHVLNKLGLDETISFPFTVPENPERIYIKYTEDVPVGESSDNFIDITNNKDEINRLRQEWNEKFHKDDKNDEN